MVTDEAAGIDEYLVPYALLERLARAAGLEPVARENFHDFFSKFGNEKTNRALLGKMGVLDTEGTLGSDEWEVAGLYRIFVFRAPLEGGGGAVETSSSLPPMNELVVPTAAMRCVPADRSPLSAKLFPSPEDIVDLIGEED